ncbi:MAG: hypothetical protein ACI8YQ_002918 [Polaribacter sp.]|jgi:hypothetical protein
MIRPPFLDVNGNKINLLTPTEAFNATSKKSSRLHKWYKYCMDTLDSP